MKAAFNISLFIVTWISKPGTYTMTLKSVRVHERKDGGFALKAIFVANTAGLRCWLNEGDVIAMLKDRPKMFAQAIKLGDVVSREQHQAMVDILQPLVKESFKLKAVKNKKTGYIDGSVEKAVLR